MIQKGGRSLRKILKEEFCRNVFTKKFLLAVVSIMLVMCLSNLEDVMSSIKNSSGSVVYLFELTINGGWFFSAMFFIAASMGSTGFYYDYTTNFLSSILARENRSRYLCAKYIASFASTFLAVAGGVILAILVLWLLFPLCRPDRDIANIVMTPYRTLLWNGNYIGYFAFRTILVAAAVALWSMAGLVVSVFKMDLLYIITAPFVINYVTGRFMMYFPECFNLDYLMTGYPILGDRVSWLAAFFYSFFVMSLIFAALGCLFYYRAGRYITGELTS